MRHILERPEYEFLKDYNIMYLALTGSHAYHLESEGSDYDMKGILYPTSEDYATLTLNDEVLTFKELDVTLYSYGAFIRLLGSNNATIMEMLYSDRVMISTPESDYFYRNAYLFENAQFMYSNLSFIDKQLTRIGNMMNSDDNIKKFNLFNLMDRVYTVDSYYIMQEVTHIDGEPFTGAFIVPDRYHQQALDSQEVDFIISANATYMSATDGVYIVSGQRKKSRLTLGDAVIGTIPGNLQTIGETSGQLTQLNHIYRNYMRGNGAFLEQRKRSGKLGKHIQQIYRVIYILQRYMDTGYVSYDVSEYKEELMAIKALVTFEEVQAYLGVENVIDYWNKEIEALKAKVDYHTKNNMARVLKEDRTKVINGLTRLVIQAGRQ